MTYIKLDDSMPDSPKVIDLTDAAFRAYISALCWCSRNRTDGLVKEGTLKRYGSARVIRELVTAELIDATGFGGYVIPNYLEYQRSREQIEALSATRSEAGSKGGRPRKPKPATPPKPKQPKTKLVTKEDATEGPNENLDETQITEELPNGSSHTEKNIYGSDHHHDQAVPREASDGDDQ